MVSVRSPRKPSRRETLSEVKYLPPYNICGETLNKLPEYVGEIYYNSEHTSRPYAPKLLVEPTDRACMTGT